MLLVLLAELLQVALPEVLQLALVEELADSLQALHSLLSLAHRTGL